MHTMTSGDICFRISHLLTTRTHMGTTWFLSLTVLYSFLNQTKQILGRKAKDHLNDL